MKARRFMPKSFNPLSAIEWVLAIFTFIGGVYIFTPLYAVSAARNGPGVVAAALTHPSLIFIYAGLLCIGSILVMLGLRKDRPQFRSAGWFVIMLVRMFQVLTTWLTVGFLPITWIYPATLAIVMLILWIFARIEVIRYAT